MNYDRPVIWVYRFGTYAPRVLTLTFHATMRRLKKQHAELLYLPGPDIMLWDYEPNFLSFADGWVASPNEDVSRTNNFFPDVTYEENSLILAEALIKSNDFTVHSMHSMISRLPRCRWILEIAYQADYDHLYSLMTQVICSRRYGECRCITANDALLREIIEERYVTLTAQLEVYTDVRVQIICSASCETQAHYYPLRFIVSSVELNTTRMFRRQA